jgi:hypothetical protein
MEGSIPMNRKEIGYVPVNWIHVMQVTDGGGLSKVRGFF